MNTNTSRSLIMLSLRSLVLLISLNSIAAITTAQDLDNVTITGRVLDQNGAVVPGAEVTATLSRTAARRATKADSGGRYRLLQLGPGSYDLEVSAFGFATQRKPNLDLLSGQNAQVDFVLQLEGIVTDAVTIVAGDPAAIDTTRTVVGGTIGPRELETLPTLHRSPLDLVLILPGVTEEPLSTRDLAEDRDASHATTPEEAGTFALSGGAAYSNNITIDGLDNNDDRAALARFQPPLEAVEEVQIITNQFSAEYGRASGGRVNLRTRGGSTGFRGRAFLFFRDEALNANTFRNNSLGLRRLPLQEHNPGFTLSGPVKLPRYPRDKTFFFIAYELDKVLDHALIDTLVPVQRSSIFPLPAPTNLAGRRFEDISSPVISAEVAPFVSSLKTPMRNQTFTTRLDHQFSETHNGAFLLQLGRLSNLRQFGGGNRLAESLQAQLRQSDSISYSDNLVLSSALVNQARIQLSRLLPAVKAAGEVGPVVLITVNDPLIAGDPARRTGTLVAGAATAGASERSETRVQVQDIVALSAKTHSLKFGVDFQRINSTFIDLADASGTYNFASAGDFLAGAPNRFRQNFQTESTQRNTYFGVFLQDEWRLRSNLVISFGLRYERESILPDNNNFGPRFSVALDPFRNGKTVIRGGAGIFYNRALLRTIDDFTLGQHRVFFDTNSLRDPVTGRSLSADERRAFIAAHLSFPGTLTIDSPVAQQFGVLSTAFSRRLDPELRIAESYQASVGFERDLGAGFVVEANYSFNRGIHLWREFNANAPVLPVGYKDFSEYLTSRDFPNFRVDTQGLRPLYNAANAGELVRFVLSSAAPNPNSILRISESGVPITLINLNSVTSTTAVEVSLAALNNLRPDPGKAEVEQLISAGNSFYHGLTLELRRRFTHQKSGLGFSFRGGYTLSSLIDDGIVNTSDALAVGDFRAERARSLLDRRHRFVFAGTFELPARLGGLTFAPVWRVASGAPFNLSLGGVDRNLDDVGNDRPIFVGDPQLLRWRAPGQPLATVVLEQLKLPTIGRTGNLARNAGQGPGTFSLDLNVTRVFEMSERVRLRPSIQFDNVLNKTVFSFGSEFINFNALAPAATTEQRQAFLDSFLVATRTMRHRQIRVGIRIEF